MPSRTGENGFTRLQLIASLMDAYDPLSLSTTTRPWMRVLLIAEVYNLRCILLVGSSDPCQIKENIVSVYVRTSRKRDTAGECEPAGRSTRYVRSSRDLPPTRQRRCGASWPGRQCWAMTVSHTASGLSCKELINKDSIMKGLHICCRKLRLKDSLHDRRGVISPHPTFGHAHRRDRISVFESQRHQEGIFDRSMGHEQV